MIKTTVMAVAVLMAACSQGEEERAQGLSSTDICMQDRAGFALNCTANDVRVAFATNIRDLSGNPLDTCIEGTTISFVADFNVNLTATARFDIGMYFDTAGDPEGDGALTGTCGVNTISPLDPVTGLGSHNFVQLDGGGDTCGDINSSHNPQIVTVQVDNVLCKAGANGLLSLPNCTSWRQSGANSLCDGVEDAFPGSPSKCNCDTGFTVGIQVRPPEAAVTKSFVALLCSEVRQQVTVRNDSITQTLSLTALQDTPHGDLFTAGHDGVLATTCAPIVIPVGGSTSCTFDLRFCGPTDTNTVTATLDDGAGTILQRVSNGLTVGVSATATSTP